MDKQVVKDQRPQDNNSDFIVKTTVAEKRSLNNDSSCQLPQTPQLQPRDQPAAKKNCYEHVNVVCQAAIDESSELYLKKLSEFGTNDGTQNGIQAINEDCLRTICKYLNIFDMIQLGQTCMRLQSFSQQVVFPAKAKQIEVQYLENYYSVTERVTIKLDHIYSTGSLKVLTEAIKFLGRYVDVFEYRALNGIGGNLNIWQSIVNVLHHCKNLKTLTISCYYRPFDHVGQEFQKLIESLTSLKVLNLLNCGELQKNWCATLNQNFSTEKLSFKHLDYMDINEHFLEYFKNISSLNFNGNSNGITKIVNQYGHCLKRLKLYLDGGSGYQLIAPVITGRLTKLEYLKIMLKDDDFIDLPQLKSVCIKFSSKSTNTLLRKLSERDMIESLEIHGGRIISEGTHMPPLIFNKMQTLKYNEFEDISIFMAMIEAQMPALHTVKFYSACETFLNELWKFIDSKKTIKSIHIKKIEHFASVPFASWSKLIDILKKPCTPNREYLYLSISSNIFIEKQTWQLLNDNRHLLKVEQKRIPTRLQIQI